MKIKYSIKEHIDISDEQLKMGGKFILKQSSKWYPFFNIDPAKITKNYVVNIKPGTVKYRNDKKDIYTCIVHTPTNLILKGSDMFNPYIPLQCLIPHP